MPGPLSLIVLAFNEEENVPTVLGDIRAWLAEHEADAEIVFIDDGSTDGTKAAAERTLAGFKHVIVRHERNRGMGAAIKTGVRAATGDWVTFLPADGQIPPSAIGTLRDAARDDQVDLVLSVYDHRDDGLHRTIMSFGVRALITLVHGVRLRSDGPYLFRKPLFDPDDLPPDTFFLNFEFPIRVLAAGLRVRTVTVPCRPRLAGVSKSTGIKRVVGVARELVELRVRLSRAAIARARGRV